MNTLQQLCLCFFLTMITVAQGYQKSSYRHNRYQQEDHPTLGLAVGATAAATALATVYAYYHVNKYFKNHKKSKRLLEENNRLLEEEEKAKKAREQKSELPNLALRIATPISFEDLDKFLKKFSDTYHHISLVGQGHQTTAHEKLFTLYRKSENEPYELTNKKIE